VQDEISAAIAGALQVKLAVAPAALRRYTPNLPAYEAYLKGNHYQVRRTPESAARSKECYEQAIALDPGFALAQIGLADDYLLATTGGGLLPPHEAMPRVRTCARKALDLDPLLPDALARLGVVAGAYDYDWKEAERLFRLAMARDPVPPQVRSWYGFFYLLPMGRPEDATREAERALQEDPLNLLFRVVVARSLGHCGRYEDESTEYRRVLELDENYWAAYLLLAWNHALRGMFTEAIPFAEKGYSMAPWNPNAISVYAAVLRRTGEKSRAEELLKNLRNAPEAYAVPSAMIMFHLACGEIDQAADWAEKALEQRDALNTDLLSLLRSSARWPALAKMMNLPAEVS
jgi:Tfp pilus assembly protein PilF